MSTHQFNKNVLSDDHFVDGELKYLVIGNECRLLDQRRTPGFIKRIDLDGGYFRWEISDFEDRGKFWDVPFEQASSYQFKNESKEASTDEIKKYQYRINELDKDIEILADSKQKKDIQSQILEISNAIDSWLEKKSEFFKSGNNVDFQNTTGPISLRTDFIKYMEENDLLELEAKTSEIQVMNPYSGDWIRGLQIVMAEMGIKDYFGSDVRSKDTFKGLGAKEKRQKYIEHRLAFVRSYFKKLGLNEAPLYRGMVTEWNWSAGAKRNYRFWSSWTFSHKVSQDFANFDPASKYKNSYLISRAIPVEKIFMTFLETDAMNKQYLEAEALVLHSDEDRLLW